MDAIAQEFYRLAGLHSYIGGIALVILFALQVYRAPQCQAKIPEKYRWEKVSFVWQHVILIVLASLGGALTSMSAEASAIDALKAALAAAQAVILTNMILRK
jgi:NADH:ubiquinone oxidoreductase subunit 6 (subunit J)